MLRATTLLLVAHAIVMAVEWVNRTQTALVWLPSDNVAQFALDLLIWPVSDVLHWGLNLAIVLAVLWLLAGAVGRLRLAIMLTVGLFLTLATANYLKMLNLGMPIFIGDLALLGFATRFMLDGWGIPWWLLAVAPIPLPAAAIWLWRRRKHAATPPHQRLAWLTGGVLLLLVITLLLRNDIRQGIIASRAPSGTTTASYRTFYEETGITLALALQLVGQPDQPSAHIDSRALARITAPSGEASSGEQPSTQPSLRPHVIFWLSESLWDPSALPNLRLSPDPLANYRRLGTQGRAFHLLVPTYGGYSSKTMFEMITGISNIHAPMGRDAFSQIVPSRPFPSIARVLAARGYDTIAIHGGMGDLFAADRAYHMLGFSRYQQETDLPHAQMVRGYVSDQSLSDHVARLVERSPVPMFLFVASMQNHAPYRTGDFSQYNISVIDPSLKLASGELLSYLEGIHQSDQALAALVDRFQRTHTPVLIVFYGDHLPGFERMFEAAGLFPYRGSPSLQDLNRKYTTPALIWTNTSLAISEIGPEVSPPAVVSAVVRTLGIEHPFYTSLLAEVTRQCPAFSPELAILPDGTLRPTPPETPAFADYAAISRALLIGSPVPRELFPEGP